MLVDRSKRKTENAVDQRNNGWTRSCNYRDCHKRKDKLRLSRENVWQLILFFYSQWR